MKKVLLMLTVCLVTSAYGQTKKTIDDTERALLNKFVDEASLILEGTLNGITDEEWTKLPGDGGWSVAQAFEHILIAWPRLLGQLNGVLKKPAVNEDNSDRDVHFIYQILDRGQTFQTPLPPETNGGMSKDEMMKQFKGYVNQFKAIANKSGVEFRSHFGGTPFGRGDAYQMMIFISGHSIRHANQMRETLKEIRN